jgi:predicted extracellular nuclease
VPVLGSALLVLVAGGAWAADHIIVGSWNIENLGERSWGQHPKALAEHIDLSGADVLALQEIHDTDGDDARRTNEKLDETFEELNTRPGHDWRYLLIPKRHEDETFQLTGVAWNGKQLKKEGELRIPVSYASDYTWNRQPHAIKLSMVGTPKADFILIPVHMKSNWDGKQLGRRARRDEARALVAKLPAVRNELGDDDIIIIGDTNCLDADEAALRALEEAGFADLNADDAVTYRKGRYSSPFDRILVPSDEPEFTYSRQYVLTPTDPGTHLRRLSDHFLVLTAIRVIED